MSGPRYVELQATSHFSFLRGASSCEDLFSQAAVCGIEALAIVDRNSVAGIVRAHEAAKLAGVRLIVGCRLDLVDGPACWSADRPAGYSRLCRLLSLGNAGQARPNAISIGRTCPTSPRAWSPSWSRMRPMRTAPSGCGA
jgi:error-prone DNA polymerase